jgi:hypothetical protein
MTGAISRVWHNAELGAIKGARQGGTTKGTIKGAPR